MINYIKFFLLIFAISFFGCKKSTTAPVAKSGVELVAIGAINYGGLVVGNFRDAAVRIYNYGPNELDTSNLTSLLTTPYSVQSISAPCSSGKLPAGQNCIIAVRFQPTAQGSFNASFSVGGASLPLTGRGMIDGVMSISDTAWNLGTIIAGDQYRKDITITNNGDFTIASPTVVVPSQVVVGYNDCGSYLRALNQCRIELISTKTVSGIYSDFINFASDGLTIPVNYIATIKPTEPSGIINFINPPTQIVADGLTEIILQSDTIRDRFENLVEDGTPVSVTGVNLTVLSPRIQYTQGGKISFQLRSAAQRGNSTITLISGEAVGVLRVKSVSGDPFGTISMETFEPNVIANGINQIVLKTLPLFDANGNVIEDGNVIYYFVEGGGILSAPYVFTANGTATVVLTTPTIIGSAVIKARSGPIYDSNNVIVDYKAKGDYQINYVPGPPNGIFPITSTYSGIYAIEDFAIEQQGINVRTQVAIGPVKDKNSNIVVAGTQITVGVGGGRLIGAGTNPAVFTTDSNGFVYITVAGNGVRGPINITASHIQGANGTHMVWAYVLTTLYYNTSSENKVTLYEKYYNALTLPSVTANWGEAQLYGGIGLGDDKNQYGQNINDFELFNSSAPVLYKDALPYLSFECFISAQHYLVLAPCQKNNDLTNEGPYAYDVLSQVDPSKISSIGIDKPYNEAHNSHDPICDDYNANINTRPSNQINCEDEAGGGGETCRWDPNSYDGRIALFGKCVPKPLVNAAYSYNEYTDQLLLFGGAFRKTPVGYTSGNKINYYYENKNYSAIVPGLIRFGNQTTVSTQLGNESFEEVGVYPSTANMMTEFAQKDNLNIGFGGYEQKILCSIFTTENLCDNALSNICEWNTGLNRCVEAYSFGMSSESKPLLTFNTAAKKWDSVAPDEDPLEPEGLGYPTERYQHGMVYIPELKMLYIAGGLRKFKCEEFQTASLCGMSSVNEQCTWTETEDASVCKPLPGKSGYGYIQGTGIGRSDIWKASMASVDAYGTGTSEWKKICGSQIATLASGLSNPAYKDCMIPAVYNDLDRTPELNKVKTTMIWNNIRQKIYIYMSNSSTVLELDPYTDNIQVSTDGSQLMSNYQQVIFNKQTGRTFGYSKGGLGQVNSKLYVWDLNPNEKKYYRVQFDLGAGSKNIAQELSPYVKAYGYTTNTTLPGLGVTAYIFNYSSNSWELIGTNTASIYTQMSGSEIYKTINTNVSSYISSTGFVNLLVTTNGNPADGGKTALGIDQIKLDGKF